MRKRDDLCQDCGQDPCVCDQMRAAHEALYGDEDRQDRQEWRRSNGWDDLGDDNIHDEWSICGATD